VKVASAARYWSLPDLTSAKEKFLVVEEKFSSCLNVR
jgi:hypothetical protein